MRIVEYFWFQGFKLFCEVVHPRTRPLILLRNLARRFRTPEVSRQPASSAAAAAIETRVPKKIWMYWAQGWESAPPLVQLCRDSWIRKNPGWEVVLLDDSNVRDYATIAIARDGKNIPHAAYSDIIRMQLLAQHGGVWADATAYCSIPLYEWLPSVAQSGFFAFEKKKTTVASWFIAAEKGNSLIAAWNSYIGRYWKYSIRPNRYFWLHYLFEYLLILDRSAWAAWEATTRISSRDSYLAQRCIASGNTSPEVCARYVTESSVPVHKLTWKIKMPGDFLEKLSFPDEYTTLVSDKGDVE